MVESLAMIAAKRIPYWSKLQNHHVVALKNVNFGIRQEYLHCVSKFSVIRDALRDLNSKITADISCQARDDLLIDYSHMAWDAYDITVDELNRMRHNTDENIKNYAIFSFVSSRIMGCPNSSKDYTDENNLMFRASLAKWEKFKFPETSGEEEPVAFYIREYFRIISNFVKLYDELYENDFKKIMDHQMQLNFFNHEHNVLKTKMDSFRSAISNIETAIICRNVSKDFTYINLF